MKNKKAIIIITASVLILLAIAPWMNNKSIQDDILQKYGRQDGSIDKNGNLFCDYEAMWLPFGRWVVSCEGGYFVPFFYFKKGNNDNTQKQQIQENNKVATETANWKNYRNEEYGFEFKYPTSWKIEDELTLNTCCLNVFGSFDPYEGNRLKKDITKAQFQYHVNKNVASKEQYINKVISGKPENYEPLIKGDSILEIQNENNLKILKFKGGAGDFGYVIPQRADFSEVVYIIIWNFDPLFEEIISTFKFTE